MALPDVQHLLVTRFSVAMGARAAHRSADWLDERLELFRAYCLPSVAAQSTEDFTWAVLCDASTPADALDALRDHERELPAMRVVVTGDDPGWQEAVDGLVRRDADVLITTRLDSDDAIHDLHLDTVRDYAASFDHSGHRRLVVCFPRGYRLDARSGEAYGAWMPTGPFHSLLERPRQGPVQTVYRGGHAVMHEHHAMHQDESIAGWIQVTHGGNVFNRLGPRDRQREPADIPGFTIRR